MFARLRQPSRSERLRNLIWPSIGWRRWFLYMRLRIIRIKDGPHSVAGGLAFGIAFSFTPFIGFHILLSVIASRVLGFNMLAAIIGTSFGNPLTLPLIWWWIFRIGQIMLGQSDQQGNIEVETLSAQDTLEILTHLFDNFSTTLLPMILGSVVIFFPVWFISYVIFKRLLIRWQSSIASRTPSVQKRKLSS